MKQTASTSSYEPVFHHVWKLRSSIGAIRTSGVAPSPSGRNGVFTKLPVGALLIVVGTGFDDLTVDVQCRGENYVVFRQDLVGEHLVSDERSPLTPPKPA